MLKSKEFRQKKILLFGILKKLIMKYSPSLDIKQWDTEGMRNDNIVNEFYVHGSAHRWSILITVQRDATQSNLFIILQVDNIVNEFYVHGSAHRWSILIIVQRDATQSSLFIILQVQSACFGCQTHPSSGVHKTVTTTCDTGHIFVQLPPSNVAKFTWPLDTRNM